MRANSWRGALGVALVLVSVIGLAGFTLHMRLVKSFPAKNQVVHEAPAAIQLWFSEKPEPALTKVRLAGPGDKMYKVDKAARTEDKKSVTLTVIDSLPEGGYTVTWQSASPDGHKVHGEYAFTYSATEPDESHSR